MIAWLLAMMICVNDCPQYLPWVSAVYSFAGTALSIWFLIGSYHIMRDIFLRGGLIRLIIYLIVFARLAQQIAKALPEQAESMQFAVLFIGAIIGLLFARLQTVLGNESPTLEPEDGPEIAHAR